MFGRENKSIATKIIEYKTLVLAEEKIGRLINSYRRVDRLSKVMDKALKIQKSVDKQLTKSAAELSYIREGLDPVRFKYTYDIMGVNEESELLRKIDTLYAEVFNLLNR